MLIDFTGNKIATPDIFDIRNDKHAINIVLNRMVEIVNEYSCKTLSAKATIRVED